jgi:hypothetical protein
MYSPAPSPKPSGAFTPIGSQRSTGAGAAFTPIGSQRSMGSFKCETPAKEAQEDFDGTEVVGDQTHEDNQRAVHQGWDNLTTMQRPACTDTFFLFLIVGMWVALTLVGATPLGLFSKSIRSNPWHLTNAVDYTGHICGYDDGEVNMQHNPYGYFMLDGTAVCVRECPAESDYYKFVCTYDLQTTVNEMEVKQQYKYVNSGQCMYVIKTQTYINRCYADMSTSFAVVEARQRAVVAGGKLADYAVYPVYVEMVAYQSWFTTFGSDLRKQAGLIFSFGILLSAVVAGHYLMLFFLPGFVFTVFWTIVACTLQFLVVLSSFLLWDLSHEWDSDNMHDKYEVLAMWVTSYAGMFFGVVFFCLLVLMIRRIEYAMPIVKEVNKVLTSMKLVFALPLLQILALALFFIPWTVYWQFTAATGTIIKHDLERINVDTGRLETYTGKTYEFAWGVRVLSVFFLWSLIWTAQFIIAIGQMAMALAFSVNFFTRDKSLFTSGSLTWALSTTLFTHIGTCAYGSLVIPPVTIVYFIISYIVRICARTDHCCAKYFADSLDWLLSFHSNYVRYITKNAYIITAIYGQGFSKAARRSYFLLKRNYDQVSATKMVSNLVLLIGKVSCCLAVRRYLLLFVHCLSAISLCVCWLGRCFC